MKDYKLNNDIGDASAVVDELSFILPFHYSDNADHCSAKTFKERLTSTEIHRERAEYDEVSAHAIIYF